MKKNNGRCRIRTCDRLIKSQLHKNTNDCKSKDLQQAESGTYKPAYKQNPKKQENPPQNLPDDLAEIVAVWPELPEHIKQSIKALARLGEASRSRAGRSGVQACKPVSLGKAKP